MSGIRGRNTRPEIAVRKHLFAAGLRFRLHPSNVPGRPDIVLPRLRSVVLVHGCFWHRHRACRFAYTPRSNIAFWRKKFSSNVARDLTVKKLLRSSGWHAYVIWECQVNERRLNQLVKKLLARKAYERCSD
jgi:DNA mismatch endonuclease, patch repair protein